jgi:precorrin-6A/cobalt-precorrin-6A reductase
MSENAAIAAARTGIHAFALVRPPWTAGPGDRWSGYPDSRSAVLALGVRKRRVFVALGRQDLDALLLAPQHRYLVRSVDPVEPALPLPDAGFLEARGPFPEDEEFELLRSNGIEAIIAKNSGGSASAAKLAAARRLAIPVHLIERPAARGLPGVETVAEAVERISHLLASAARRGA